MCDPVSATIATVVGAGASLFGSIQAASAAKRQQQAIVNANNQTLQAQNQGFTQRIQAGLQQTAGQSAASQQTLADRNTAATQMRQQQQQALKDYQDTINAQNAQAERLRQTGDVQAQALLAKTTAPEQQASEAQYKQQAAELVAANAKPEGPQETNPGGTDAVSRDPVTRAALARRTAEAATNIRDYGSKIATVGAYGASPQAISLDVADTKYGIMPAQRANELLQSGSAVRLLPSKVAYGAATGMGQAYDALIGSRGQNALDAAGLSFGNATSIANLSQADAEQLAKNRLAQAQANASAAEAQAGILKGIGQLGLYGGGYAFGGGGPTLNAGFKSVGDSLGSLFK